MSVGRPRWTWRSTCSTACRNWDARPTSASPDPGRGWGQCGPTPDPCTTLAHALPALLGGEWGQEEGHGLPVLLRHDGGPGRRAKDVAVLLTPVLATRMAGLKGLKPRLEQR